MSKLAETSQENQIVDPNLDSSVGMYDENYANYDQYEGNTHSSYSGDMNVDDNKGKLEELRLNSMKLTIIKRYILLMKVSGEKLFLKLIHLP